MQMQNIIDLYIIILLSLVGSSIFLLISNNSVHSVLYLILCFFHAAIILFIFNVEFLGLAFIIIYVGAIAVLFLFVVMMLNVKEDNVNVTLQEFLIPFSFFVIFYLIVKNTFLNWDYSYFYFYSFFDNLTNINLLGQLLYNYCLIDILIAGFVLLVAIIGPVILTLTFANKKNIVAYRQLTRSENVITFISFLKK
jgi:NADH-quinone oxidoreductase subunit J